MTTTSSSSLSEQLLDLLVDSADAAQATRMQRYMKSEMPYLGIKTPALRALTKPFIRANAPLHSDAYTNTINQLWESATYREERYTALDYARHHHKHIHHTQLPLYASLVRDGAWWDYVDVLAAHLVGPAVRNAKSEQEGPGVMDAWIVSDSLWLRRAAILHQLGAKQNTDATRLFEYVEQCMHEEEFFIRKAIGWALREYARHAPDEVLAFVGRHEQSLSNLSRREALKHFPKTTPHNI